MNTMNKSKWKKFGSAALIALSLAGAVGITGCAVGRHQSTTGEYVDDSVITTKIKAKFAEDKTVAATSINVETLQGVVQLSGFAKNATEKANAEKLAKSVEGVKSVKNSIVVQP